MHQFSNIKFKYDPEKNATLLNDKTRNKIGFDQVISAMLEGKILAITDHFNKLKYPNQKIAYIHILDVVYKVPFVIENDGSFFLKTVYPSSKASKEFFPNRKKNKS